MFADFAQNLRIRSRKAAGIVFRRRRKTVSRRKPRQNHHTDPHRHSLKTHPHPRLFTIPMETEKLPLRRTRPLRAFRFFSFRSASPRRTLAHRTKITAPARHDNSPDFRPAAKTLLALSAVSSVM